MSIELESFYETFFDEADELLESMEQQLVELDPAAPDIENLNAIFRAAHSIKGGAGAFGFERIQNTTHRLENLLDRARQGQLTLTKEIVDLFLECNDALKNQIAARRQRVEPDAREYERVVALLDGIAESAPTPATDTVVEPAAAAARTIPGEAAVNIVITRVEPAQVDTLAEELALFGDISDRTFADGRLSVTLTTDVDTQDIESVLCFVVDADQISFGAASAEPTSGVAPVVDAPAPEAQASTERDTPAAATSRPASKESTSIRVSTEKVDEIINLVGELVITQSMLEQATSGLDPDTHRRLGDGLAQLERNARDLQESVMSIRMVPMDIVFKRFPRLVRDLSGKLGKQVELVTEGESTELDKSLIERIMDPLTHLVRNSLDHGIETAERRAAVNKPAVGRLTLAARHQGGSIVIEIRDDGAGLDRRQILDKARGNGLDVSEQMPDEEVWQLIFEPGFSTAAAVTDVSGRGVGMDVVKRNIQTLGGHVDIESAAGRGTTIRIVLPLTLAIMDGMLLRVGDETFVIPVGTIIETVQARGQSIYTVGSNHHVLRFRGEHVPLVDMRRVFDMPQATDDVQSLVMVLSFEGRRFGLCVDELLGQRQVVVKNLETHYRKVDGISAATILGDGSVSLILDVGSLARSGRETAKLLSVAKTAS